MSSDFQRRFKGKTEIMNKNGISGLIQNTATPIEKSTEIKTLNVNQFQPYDNYQMPNGNINPNINMDQLNELEEGLMKNMEEIN